jgi:protein involved in plasmid replication-relaxation
MNPLWPLTPPLAVPFGQPAARPPRMRTPGPATDDNRPAFAGDTIHSRSVYVSPSTASTYVTQRVVSELQSNLSDRDFDILHTIHRLGLVSGRQLQRLFFPPSPTGNTTTAASRGRRARHVLRRLSERQLIGRLARRVGGPPGGSGSYIYGPSIAGHRLLDLPGRPRRPYQPDNPKLLHTLAIAEVYVQLVEAERAGRFVILDHQAEPDCWVQAAGERLEPDGYVRLQLPDGRRCRWFLEIDNGGPRGAQSSPRIEAKLDVYRRFWERRLVDAPAFPRVLYVAVREQRAAALRTTIDRQPPTSRQLFAVCPLAELPTFISAVDWYPPGPLALGGLRALLQASDGC